MKKSVLRERAIEFSVEAVVYYRWLVQEKKEFVMSKQMLRSATSIGANIHEACYAVSRPDFINKMQIALKEAAETEYWLLILNRTNLAADQFDALGKQCEELKKMLTATLNTSKNAFTNQG